MSVNCLQCCRPTQLSMCTSIPGLSDHDIVLTDTNIIPLRQKPPKRLVYLWKKADISGMEDDLHQFAKTFTTEFLLILPLTHYGPPSIQRASHLSANMYPPKWPPLGKAGHGVTGLYDDYQGGNTELFGRPGRTATGRTGPDIKI